jgi:glucose/arabinose dehydrogenase
MRSAKFAILIFVAAVIVSMLACSKDKKNPVTPNPPPPGSLSLRLEPVASGLGTPVFLTSPPNDSRLFIVVKTGAIRIVKNGSLLATPFVNLSGLIGSPDFEQGILCLLFDKNYGITGKFYVSYTDASNDVHVARFHVNAGNPDLADPAPEANLITIEHSSETNHNGGMLAWGPNDGFLYLSVGDGGGASDPNGHGQDKGDWLGNILRLDSNGNAAPGNPFSSPDKPEIWSYGLRNPWRFSFDRQNGDLYIADVGQGEREEIDVSTTAQGAGRGVNFGWNLMEGLSCFSTNPCNQPSSTLPVLDYDHSANACAVVGGYVYRGTAIAGLQGTYFYGDYCAGFVRSFRYSGGQVTEETSWPSLQANGLTSFGEDSAGELYLMTDNGDVQKIVSN